MFEPTKYALTEADKYLSLLKLVSQHLYPYREADWRIVDLAGKHFVSSQVLSLYFPRAEIIACELPSNLPKLADYYGAPRNDVVSIVNETFSNTNIRFVPIELSSLLSNMGRSPEVLCLDFCSSFLEFDSSKLKHYFKECPFKGKFIIYNTSLTRTGSIDAAVNAARKRVRRIIGREPRLLGHSKYHSAFKKGNLIAVPTGKLSGILRLWSLWR
jgi:hypothetical protein